MRAHEVKREIDRILAKKRRGETLTRKEARIIAYGLGGGCSSCYSWVSVRR